MNNQNQIELTIAKLLRTGVVVAGMILGTGWLWFSLNDSINYPQFKSYSQVNFITQIEISFLDNNWGVLISYLGLITLIMLPLLRVLFSTWLFIKKKEITMGIIGIMITLSLLTSFILGFKV